MKATSESNRVSITKSDLSKVEEFISKISTTHYASRGQNNPDKRKLDQKVGKLGELASYHLLKDKFDSLSPPDFEIYAVRKKSWAGDLPYDGGTIHSKSQLNTQAKRYGSSWVFEKKDKEIFEKYSDNDWVSFTTVNLESGYVELTALVKVADLHSKNLFSDLKLDYLNQFKRCVYQDDLIKKGMIESVG